MEESFKPKRADISNPARDLFSGKWTLELFVSRKLSVERDSLALQGHAGQDTLPIAFPGDYPRVWDICGKHSRSREIASDAFAQF